MGPLCCFAVKNGMPATALSLLCINRNVLCSMYNVIHQQIFAHLFRWKATCWTFDKSGVNQGSTQRCRWIFFVLFPKNSREIPRVSHKNGEDHHNSVWHLHNNALLAGEEGAIQYNKQMIRVLSSPFSFVL